MVNSLFFVLLCALHKGAMYQVKSLFAFCTCVPTTSFSKQSGSDTMHSCGRDMTLKVSQCSSQLPQLQVVACEAVPFMFLIFAMALKFKLKLQRFFEFYNAKTEKNVVALI